MVRRLKAAAACLMAASILSISAAQAETRLKMAHGYAESHYHSVEGLRRFVDEVAKRSHGELVIEVYPAYQLGKAQAPLLKAGLVDMAFVTPPQEPDKFPLSSVMELPGVFSGSCDMTNRLSPLMDIGGELQKQEYGPQGYRVLYLGMMAQYDIYTSAKPIAAPSDIAGLKLRGNGGTLGRILRSFDAVPVSLASTEVYDSLTRGTIDGLYFPASGVHPYSLETAIKYGVTGLSLGAAGSVLVINEKTFQNLSPEVQQILIDVGQETQAHFCEYIDSTDAELRTRMETDNGITLTHLTPEQSAEWSAKVSSVVEEWVGEMSKARRQGQPVLDALGYSAQN